MSEDLLEEFHGGVLPDERTVEEKQRDYRFDELVASPVPVQWRTVPRNEWRNTPIYNQGNSGACVAFAIRKIIEMEIENKTGEYIQLSAAHIYQRRWNRPSPGMSAVDAFTIAQKGVTLEQFVRSELMTDAQLDSAKVTEFMQEVGKAFAIGNYVEILPRTIDNVASVIQHTNKGVLLFAFFSDRLQPIEWTDVPRVQHPTLPITGPNTVRHAIAGKTATLWNQEKAIVVDDSWGLARAMEGQRVLTEPFFNSRVYYAGYFSNFKYQISTPPAAVRFDRDLEFSNLIDQDVVRLQEFLKTTGDFPINQSSTGRFLGVTLAAVQRFQIRNGIANSTTPGFGRVGPHTRAIINSGNFK